MAVIRFINKAKRAVPAAVGREVWFVKSGHKEPTPEQVEYCKHIEHIWLDWHTAPDKYIVERFDTIVRLHFADWMLDHKGMLTLPPDMPYLAYNPYDFAVKWGLIEHGKVTEKGSHYLDIYQPERTVIRVFAGSTRKDLV